jgi:hypothetical protein
MPQENGRVTRDCVQINVKHGDPPCWVVRPEGVSGFNLGWCANSLCFGSANGAVNTSIWSHKNVVRSNNCRICTVSSLDEALSDCEHCCWIVADRDIAVDEEILVLYGSMYSNPQSTCRSDTVLPRGRAGRPSKISKLRGRAKHLKMQSSR